jgi:lipoate-protein ligase A
MPCVRANADCGSPLANYEGRVIFERLMLWLDPVKRPGPEAMAVDEWLLQTATDPVLRVYGWQGHWGSVGYFGNLDEARAAFPGIDWVRRWTGGGTVDHREDWTYTLIAPAGCKPAAARGAESYRMIHAALAEVLLEERIEVRLSAGTDETGKSLCFENPVSHDLVGTGGRKLAGAGQRRTRRGLLHQGSVAAPCDAAASCRRGERLATHLAENRRSCDLRPPRGLIESLVLARYGSPSWTRRC